MKKYLLYSDTHFSQYSSIVRSRGAKYSTRLHNLINSISWAERLADSENCDEVIMLGDAFDRSDLNAEELTALQDVYFCNKPHTFITGNHDANISNLEFSTIQVFKSIKASIITDIKIKSINDYVDFYFIPYLTEKHVSLKDFLLDNNKKKVVLTHNDIAGIQYGKFVSQSGFNIEDIVNNCTLFLDGHLHNGCVIDNKIVLVGNLTGQNFNENAQQYAHYAYILSVEDNGAISLESYENPYAFNFYKLRINTVNDFTIIDSLKQNAVLSISCNNTLISKLTEEIKKKSNIVEYRIISIYNNSSQRDVVDFKVEDHLQQFIDYVQTKIQPSDVLLDELGRLSS